ncbi:hypothetical protein AMTRI_Chr02g265900 [Amborella trichopoda]
MASLSLAKHCNLQVMCHSFCTFFPTNNIGPIIHNPNKEFKLLTTKGKITFCTLLSSVIKPSSLFLFLHRNSAMKIPNLAMAYEAMKTHLRTITKFHLKLSYAIAPFILLYTLSHPQVQSLLIYFSPLVLSTGLCFIIAFFQLWLHQAQVERETLNKPNCGEREPPSEADSVWQHYFDGCTNWHHTMVVNEEIAQ